MNSTFSGHFGYRRLLRVTLPSIVMMIFTSIYCVTDGFFVSNFAGKAAFTAVNFIMPYLMILGCVGFLFGTGGSALIGKTMGEGDRKHADRLFSMVICVTALSGLALGVLGIVLLRPVAELLGAEGELLENCVRYGRLILIANPAYVLQFAFQCLFATAGKPKLGLAVTVAAGVTNMALDALFVGVFRWGLAGAAVATTLSQCVGGLLPLLYFLGKWNRSELHLTRFRFDWRALGRICGNGSSELMSNISMSLVGMLYNAQLMRYGGQNGIAAYGVLMYVSMIFHACFIGYAVGVSPVVSFHFGAQNRPELHSLLRKSLRLIGGSSIAMLAAGEALPSIRALAKDLRISVITTKRAYEELEREGLITSQTGRGSFVAPVSSERLREAQLRTVEDHLTDAVQAARLAGLSADEFAELARTLFEEEGL